MEECMKKIIRFLFLACLVFLFFSCATTGLTDFYRMDLRFAKMPIMMNENLETSPGRDFLARVSESATASTSTYSGYNYSVSVTTTTSEKTGVPLDYQLVSRSLPDDTFMRIREIIFFHHILMMPYYSENAAVLSVGVSYHHEGDIK
jgi:hypothetical protein